VAFFSIVIPSYNRGPFITATLDSVFAQDCTDFEVIVVDDGSTDDTIERLQPYRSRITVLQQPNKGPGAARNLGVQHSSGEYIAFLDSDDLWFRWTLATYAQIVAGRNPPALVAGRLVYFQNESELASLQAAPPSVESFTDYFESSRKGLYCGTCQMLVRRSDLLKVGGFVETKINAEDHDLTMRLGTAHGFVNVISPGMIGYRQHSQAVTKDLSKTFTGLVNLLEMEKSGKYPGGAERRRDRQRILSQHVRPLTLDLLRQKELARAWQLYRQTFAWNITLGRLRYLTGFAGHAFLSLLRR
jgi:GT2 family glycosyltransferase